MADKKAYNVVHTPYSLEKGKVGQDLGVSHFKRFTNKKEAEKHLNNMIKNRKGVHGEPSALTGYSQIVRTSGPHKNEPMAYNASKHTKVREETILGEMKYREKSQAEIENKMNRERKPSHDWSIESKKDENGIMWHHTVGKKKIAEDAEDFDAGVDVENPGTSKEIKKVLLGKNKEGKAEGMTDEKPEVPGDSAAIEKTEQNEAVKPSLQNQHFWDKKTHELHYIRKDAHAAAKAMRGHDPKAEGKYLDQVNDAETVLAHRRKFGEEAIVESALEDKPMAVADSFEELLHGIILAKVEAYKEEMQKTFLDPVHEEKEEDKNEDDEDDKEDKKESKKDKKDEDDKDDDKDDLDEGKSFRRDPEDFDDVEAKKKIAKQSREIRKSKKTVEEETVEEGKSFRRDVEDEEPVDQKKKIAKAFREVRKTKKNIEEANWIAGAVKHPGKETKLAKKAGETTHEYMEKHKDDSGAAGKRARLGLTLSKLSKEEADVSESTFDLNPAKKGMWKGKSEAEIEKAKVAAKKSGNVTREREAVFALNAKAGKFKKGA